MRTVRVRRQVGDDAIVVTRTKQGRILICETDWAGASTITTLQRFEAFERRVRILREMIDLAQRQPQETPT